MATGSDYSGGPVAGIHMSTPFDSLVTSCGQQVLSNWLWNCPLFQFFPPVASPHQPCIQITPWSFLPGLRLQVSLLSPNCCTTLSCHFPAHRACSLHRAPGVPAPGACSWHLRGTVRLPWLPPTAHALLSLQGVSSLLPQTHFTNTILA